MKENIGYCPNCKKVVFRRGEAEVKNGNRFVFETRCSHCQTPIKVSVGAEIIIYKNER